MRAIVALLAVAAVAVVSIEVGMQPTASDRWAFIGIVLAATLLAAATPFVLDPLSRRLRSLRSS